MAARRHHASEKKPRRAKRISPDEIKARRRARIQQLRAELANDHIDNLSAEQMLEKFEPMPRGLDQLGDLPEPEYKPPYWVDIG